MPFLPRNRQAGSQRMLCPLPAAIDGRRSDVQDSFTYPAYTQKVCFVRYAGFVPCGGSDESQ